MRCLIVDDHPLTRDGTSLALRASGNDVEVVEAGSLKQAFDVLGHGGKVDLVLLDLCLEESDGLATLQSFMAWCDANEVETRVVVLSAQCDPDLVRSVVELYATGFILKVTSQEIFRHAIALTLAGGVYIPDIALRQMDSSRSVNASAQAEDVARLTPREREVASLLVMGYPYKKIARELERRDGKPISEHTVRAHVGNIAWKLGVTENAKAGVMAEIARRQLKFPVQATSGA